jgi:hypothetical protein
MFVTGVAILMADGFTDWKKYVPLIVGMWLPFSMIVMLILGKTDTSMIFLQIYSIWAWFLMGIVAYHLPPLINAEEWQVELPQNKHVELSEGDEMELS